MPTYDLFVHMIASHDEAQNACFCVASVCSYSAVVDERKAALHWAAEEKRLRESGMPDAALEIAASDWNHVGARFDVICFVGLGQDADIRELQRSIHFQLTGTALPANLKEESEVFVALQEACRPT